MNYDNYFVDSEKVMTLDDITMYANNKDCAYILIKRPNNKGEDVFRLEKVVILNVHEREGFFEDDPSETRISVITLKDELHAHFSLSDMGKYYVFLKSKPGEEYIKLSVDNFVVQGRYCKDCKYCSNLKIFSDEYLDYHNGSCLLFLTYLDFDRKIGEMNKCDKCKKVTG